MLYCKDFVITSYLYINDACTRLLFGKTNIYIYINARLKSPIITPKSDGMLSIQTPKSEGDRINHTDVMDNAVLTIQIYHALNGSSRLSRRSTFMTVEK